MTYSHYALILDSIMPEIALMYEGGALPIMQYREGKWWLGGGDVVFTFKVDTVKLCDCGDDSVTLEDVLEKANRILREDDTDTP